MNRCSLSSFSRSALSVTGLCAVLLSATPALAQHDPSPLYDSPAHSSVPTGVQPRMRAISPKAERGWIEFLSARDAVVDGQSVRIGAGFRLRDERNRLFPVSRLVGARLQMFYVIDPFGFLQEAWVMADGEQHRFSPKERREQDLRMQGIDPTQNLRKRRNDLRNVPFDQLPRAPSNLP